MTIRFLLLVLLLVTSCFPLIAQRNEKPVNLVFLDKKFPRSCSVCEAKTETEKSDHLRIKAFIKNLTCKDCPKIKLEVYTQKLLQYADTATGLSDFGKAQIYYRVAADLMVSEELINGRVHNVWQYMRNQGCRDSSHIDRLLMISEEEVLAGADEILKLLQKASDLSDDSGKDFLKHLWLKYAYESGLVTFIHRKTEAEAIKKFKIIEDEWLDFPRIDGIPIYLRENRDLVIIQASEHLLQEIDASYQFTGFNPKQSHLLITPSFNYLRSNREHIGGELALEIASLRNPYKFRNRTLDGQIYARTAMFFGYNQQMDNANLREFYFGSGRISQVFFGYLNVIQFGWKNGIDADKNARWFYRPEIGLAYGNFQAFYSYTHMFNKEMRGLVDRHALNLRLTLPHVRVSRYN